MLLASTLVMEFVAPVTSPMPPSSLSDLLEEPAAELKVMHGALLIILPPAKVWPETFESAAKLKTIGFAVAAYGLAVTPSG